MKQLVCQFLKVGLIVSLTSLAQAQSVTPITTSTIIPTTAASPVVTANTTTTATTTTGTTTLYQIYAAQVAAEMAAAQTQAEAQAKATQRAEQMAAALKLGIQYCPFFRESQAQKTRKNINDIERQLGKQADESSSKDRAIDTAEKKSVAEGKAAMDFPEACSIFMKDNGELGSVGNKVIAQIRENRSVFADKVPKDMGRYCKNYESMNPEQRNMFWVWAMMSMASHESSCEPTAVNKNNPKAVGLFQLNTETCGDANLRDGLQNADCAVKRLATEMSKRNTLVSKTANGENGTYWAVLCMGNEKNCGDNGDAAKNTFAMISSYPDCGNSPKSSETKGKGSRGTASEKSSKRRAVK
ncbi:transglycosylase SLT domain-containing protein [Bdellovibrio sp. SKB1291214]|uniref:transglycosylase SLT domain-containing protein n=1 Tax=Bdellovibrio sp. SKB1291214 TaxID=1732569 RepID=UPI000B514E63|nr:transglycosylase SLT domain-containing protein [Bdellovibrio sp. SKB1291214]UYL10031.1 transglycosylase SLT domain-containing protein [Bdellovibrio sp. SKB1291214]